MRVLPLIVFVLGGIYIVFVTRTMYSIAYPSTGVYEQGEKRRGLVESALVDGDELTVSVHITHLRNPRDVLSKAPIWQGDVKYGVDEPPPPPASVNLTLNVSRAAYARAGGKIWANVWVFVTRKGASADPRSPKFRQELTSVQAAPFRLIEYIEPKRERALLGNDEDSDSGSSGGDDNSPDSPTPSELVPHYKTKIPVRLVHEPAAYPRHALPAMGPRLHHAGKLVPLVFVDDMWVTRDDFAPLDAALKAAREGKGDAGGDGLPLGAVALNLTIDYAASSAAAFRIGSTMRQAIDQQTKMMGGSQKETDELKLMFVENSPAVLLASIIVAVLHLVFEFLSVTNDVSFWRSRKSLEGVSLRALCMQCVSKFIVLLYLNEQGANALVRLGVVVDWGVSVYKVTTAFRLHVTPNKFPFVGLELRAKGNSVLDEYDRYAIEKLSLLLFPLMGGYFVYSLCYEKHRSIYAFVIGWLASCVYAFGFILMTPQLFLNYKLKSVAHLPWRAMIYKFLNTFIDDVFAFIIRMPTMHRVSVLRDDIVFFIYLYQRWIYPVDAKRHGDMGGVIDSDDGDADINQKGNGEKIAEGESDNSGSVAGETDELRQGRGQLETKKEK